MKRSRKTLPAERVRELKREAERIDREEAEALKEKGRAIKAKHDEIRKRNR